MVEFNLQKKFQFGKWHVEIIKVETAIAYGYFERETDGTGGGLWFERDDDAGTVELVDYDGVAVLPQAISDGLRAAGYIVGEGFDA